MSSLLNFFTSLHIVNFLVFLTFCGHLTASESPFQPIKTRAGAFSSLPSLSASRGYAELFAAPNCAPFPLTDAELSTALDAFIKDYMSCLNMAGLQVGLIRRGEIIYSKAFGIADAETQQPVNTQTLFGIGSTSKAFTSMLFGQLVDGGVISFDDLVSSIYPEFRLYDPMASSMVTIRDLLSHRSGVPRHDQALLVLNRTRESLIPHAVFLPPTATIRNEWQYTNWMVSVAGSIAGWLNGFGIGGGNWESALHRNIFQPLNMSLSKGNFSSTLPVTNRANIMHSTGTGQWTNDNWNANLIIDPAAPSGGINSCVEDMLKWLSVHLSNSSVPLVSPATLAELHRGNIVMTVPGVPPIVQQFFLGDEYALNWIKGAYRGHRRIQHDGGTVGFTSLVSLLPNDGIGFFAVTNSADAPTYWALTLSSVVFDLALGLEPIFNLSQACNSPCSIFPNYPGCPSMDSPTNDPIVPPNGSAVTVSPTDYIALYLHPAYGQINVSKDVNGTLQATSWVSFTGEPVTSPLTLIQGEVFSWESAYPQSTVEFVRTQRAGMRGEVISLTLYYINEIEYHITFSNTNYHTEDQNTACSFSSNSGVHYVSSPTPSGGSQQVADDRSSGLTAGMLALTIVLSVVGSSLLATCISIFILKSNVRRGTSSSLRSTE